MFPHLINWIILINCHIKNKREYIYKIKIDNSYLKYMRSILFQSGKATQLKNGNVSNYNSFPVTSSMILSLFYHFKNW